ncbi:MAG: pyruvate kinase [Deltaproteobacteria bacterium]|nr:pyruvate kinase [Deltaproteobacteria bacterium]
MSTPELLAPKTSRGYRKTKIVATVGPACRSPEVVKEMILAGTNVFRLNFSHGSWDEHTEEIKTIRKVSATLRMPVAVLQDLSGPKIRISKIDGDFVALPDNAAVDLRPSDGSNSTAATIFVEGLNPAEILKAGEQVLLADGIIELKALSVEKGVVHCTALKGGRLRSRVGIAFPDSIVDLPATTDKDIKDLMWGIENEVDYVAISFVKNAQDVLMLREVIRREGGDIKIISKIERKSALSNIFEIMDASDGIMVARGDLGLEVPLEQLPMLQKRLIEQSNYRGIPVIVATQMLQSMITSVRPTRAEVSDVATAVMSGADAVMLSEETTIGQHPVECVKTLGKIAHEAEQSFAFEEYKLRLRDADRATVPDAVAYAASAAAVKMNAAAIIACTETGTTARLVAKYRPQQPLYGVSSSPSTLQRMSLYWGVNPIPCSPTSTHEDEIDTALRLVQARENLANGSRTVILGGISVRTPGATSVLEIREIAFK